MSHESLFDAQIVYDALDDAGENGYNMHRWSAIEQTIDLMTYYQPLENADLIAVLEAVQNWRAMYAAVSV